MTDTDYIPQLYVTNGFHVRRCRKSGIFYEDITPQQLLDLLKSQLFLCPYCGLSIHQQFHLDHIQPLTRGGEHVIANLQFTCPRCNQQKQNSTSFTGTLYVEPSPLPEPANANDPDTVDEAGDWLLSPP